MPQHDPKVTLLQMRDHAREAMELAGGHTRADLEANRVLELALIHLIEVTGEAANRLPRELRDRYPQIPWAQVVGMRNRLIHGYDSVNRNIVWDTIAVDFPPLVHALEDVLASWDE